MPMNGGKFHQPPVKNNGIKHINPIKPGKNLATNKNHLTFIGLSG
jgi:hypothetical protein